MEELTVNSVVFEVLEDSEHALRIWVTGTGFTHGGTQVAAAVGDVPVRRLTHTPGGGGFSGLLPTVPAEGAPLRVGWLGTRLTDTGVTFSSEST